METNHKKYDFEKSLERMDDILDASDTNYEEVDEIPSRSELTFTNGFYMDCNAIFVDIRDSSELPDRYYRPTLAKIYRAYISEIVAIMNSYEICKEINIVGDCVSGIFEANKKEYSKTMVDVAAQINSLVKILNYKMSKKNIDPIKIGIGIAKGRALMIKAGFSGSGINDVVWMGDVVNEASNLCGLANKDVPGVIVISEKIYSDLEGYENFYGEKYQSWFQRNLFQSYYYGDVVNISMNDWLEQQINNQ
ncbi:adenylate/guanylate cyclase domain-containing protein (plasmid) [Anoxybacillus caldiproteolyticus]|nr:adenylate/guanylate cyclase domain-containing protein [Anoxybacillus caldiproteolyticus]